jgi:predicted RNase H-like HicB family nuclease
MKHNFTLEYWIDDGWYVGKLKEIPGVFSQGETLEELHANLREVVELLADDGEPKIKPPGAWKGKVEYSKDFDAPQTNLAIERCFLDSDSCAT